MKKLTTLLFTVLLLGCQTIPQSSDGLSAYIEASVDGGEWFHWGPGSGTAYSDSPMKLRGTRSKDNSTKEIVEYHWNFGDGTTAKGEYVEHIFPPGTWDITLTVVDKMGNFASETLPWSVFGESQNAEESAHQENIRLIAYIETSIEEDDWFHWGPGSGTGLAEITMKFRGTESAKRSSVEIVQYLWDFGDGSTAEGEFVEHTFTTGTWNISLTVVDKDGNEGNQTIPWAVRGQSSGHDLVAYIETSIEDDDWFHWGPGSGTGLSEITMKFRGTDSVRRSSVEIVQYLWDFGDGSTAEGEFVEHTFTTGTWNISLTVVDKDGNEGNETIPWEVRGTR
jgi:chitodextrinase